MINDIHNCVKSLQKGGVILYPTDTIWGLGCDISNLAAIRRILDIKQIDRARSMIILLSDVEQIFQYVEAVPDTAMDLMLAVDKPLTIIYPQAKGDACHVAAEDGSIGIRVVKHVFCQKVIEMLGRPIVSTSANVSGKASPINFKSVDQGIKEAVDYVVDPIYDVLMEVKASQIIKLETSGLFTVIRS